MAASINTMIIIFIEGAAQGFVITNTYEVIRERTL